MNEKLTDFFGLVIPFKERGIDDQTLQPSGDPSRACAFWRSTEE